MQIKSNISVLIKKFQRLAEEAKTIDATAALEQGLNSGRAAMNNRIFDKGLDADNITLGKYTKAYAKKRVKANRFIDKKDLEFTGSLRRAIITAAFGENKAGVFINNQREKEIAQYQEEQVGSKRGSGRVKIFGISKAEKEFVKEQTQKALNQLYVRLFNA
jgi:hypothetical protein